MIIPKVIGRLKPKSRIVLQWLAAAVLVYSLVNIVLDRMDRIENEQIVLEARALHDQVVEAPIRTSAQDTHAEAFQGTASFDESPLPVFVNATVPTEDDNALTHAFNLLQSKNEDIVGWITLPDTEIDYPVVQGKDNDYYLTHASDKSRNISGAIFMDYRNDSGLKDFNTIIYGHRMKDGSMFQDLSKLQDPEFFNQHGTFYYETPEGRTQWEIFSVYVTSTDFYYIQPDFESEDEYLEFLKELQRKSMHRPDADVSAKDRIITLSTCSYQFEDARLAVHARLVDGER